MHSLPTRGQAYARCAVAALAIVTCGGILGAAVLMSAPPVVVPFLAAVCIGCPMVLGWSVPTSVAVLRATGSRVDARAMQALRRHLDSLPETQHPLGF